LGPAFCDHHLHLDEMLQWAAAVDLGGCVDAAGIRTALDLASKGEGEEKDWLTAFGLDLNRFEGWGASPMAVLDQAVAARPVAVFSQDLHSVFINQRAAESAGIKNCPDGLLREEKCLPIREALPAPEGRDLAEALARIAGDLHALGIVAVDDMGGAAIHLRLHALDTAESLPLKITTSLHEADLYDTRLSDFKTGRRRGRLQDGPLKLFADGSLGSRNAFMLLPYQGSEDRGQLNYTKRHLAGLIRSARARELSLAVHAIGDAAVREVIGHLGPGDRMEHAQHMHKEDVARLAATGAAACVNPSHIELDWRSCEHVLPEGGLGAYPLAWLADAGVPLLFASDAPVMPPGPLAQVRWAETRQTKNGEPKDGWFAEQRMGRMQALRAIWPRGASLSSGAPADLLALSADVSTLPANELEEVQVKGLWLEGERQV